MTSPKVVIAMVAGGAIVAGLVVGYSLSRSQKKTTTVGPGTEIIKSDKIAGLKDCKGDKATGKLDKTTGKEQGTHKLLRDGGPSQTVYLVSSVVDLEEYVGKKIEICGDTQRVQGVGWFVDVARVQIVE